MIKVFDALLNWRLSSASIYNTFLNCWLFPFIVATSKIPLGFYTSYSNTYMSICSFRVFNNLSKFYLFHSRVRIFFFLLNPVINEPVWLYNFAGQKCIFKQNCIYYLKKKKEKKRLVKIDTSAL
jgi:hypothetical protein